MPKIIILLIITYVSLSLHTHNAINHLLNTPKRHLASEVDTLYFQDQFTDLIGSVDYIKRALSNNSTAKFDVLITKTSQIRAGFEQLKDALLSQQLPVTQSSKICPGITTFNRTQLRKYIVSIEQNERIALQYMSTCIDCTFVSDDLKNLQNLTSLYIKNLNQTLDGLYCDTSKVNGEKAKGLVNLNNSYFKCNLQAKNWYYGSTTASDYKMYIFKRSASYNLTNCPLSTPFVRDDDQNCIDCPQGSIFNLGTQRCDTCKKDEILNIQSGQCDRCLGQKKFINGSLVCKLCVLADGELFNVTNGKCYKCGKDTYLDTAKLACVKIDCSLETPRFNPTTKLCEPCNVSEIVDPHNVTKCIKTNYIGLCPPQTPLYDSDTKQCTECPKDTTFSRVNNQCVASSGSQAHTFRKQNN